MREGSRGLTLLFAHHLFGSTQPCNCWTLQSSQILAAYAHELFYELEEAFTHASSQCILEERPA